MHGELAVRRDDPGPGGKLKRSHGHDNDGIYPGVYDRAAGAHGIGGGTGGGCKNHAVRTHFSQGTSIHVYFELDDLCGLCGHDCDFVGGGIENIPVQVDVNPHSFDIGKTVKYFFYSFNRVLGFHVHQKA